MVHASTGQLRPYTECTGTLNPLPKTFTFGQLGWIPNFPHTTKRNYRGRKSSYMGMHNKKTPDGANINGDKHKNPNSVFPYSTKSHRNHPEQH